MSNEKAPNTTDIKELARRKIRELIDKIRGFFEPKELEGEVDESRRGFFKLTVASAAGVAVKSSGADRLLDTGQISKKEFQDTITLLQSTSNGSGTFLIQFFRYFSRPGNKAINLKQRFASLFSMDEQTLNDSDLSVLIHNFKLPGQDFDFELIDRIFKNQKLLEQLGVDEDIIQLVKGVMSSGNFSGSVNDFIKKQFAEPLFSEAENFVNRISQNGIKSINPVERKFLKELQTYIGRHKLALSRSLSWEKVAVLEDRVKRINFALNPEEFLKQARNEELKDMFEKHDFIEAENAIFSQRYAPAKRFADKALAEGRQVSLSAVESSEMIVVSEKTEFGQIFDRLKECSPTGVVKASQTSTHAELFIN